MEGREWRRLIKRMRMLWKSKQGFTAATESRLDECVGRVMGEGGSGRRLKNDGDASAARFTALLSSSSPEVIATICRWNREYQCFPTCPGY